MTQPEVPAEAVNQRATTLGITIRARVDARLSDGGFVRLIVRTDSRMMGLGVHAGLVLGDRVRVKDCAGLRVCSADRSAAA